LKNLDVNVHYIEMMCRVHFTTSLAPSHTLSSKLIWLCFILVTYRVCSI